MTRFGAPPSAETSVYLIGTDDPPPNYWVASTQPDEVALLKEEFNFWLQGVSKNEKLFEQNVYKNPNLTGLDLHQHRARLYTLLARGEGLIVKFYAFAQANKIDPSGYYKVIEENLNSLTKTFNDWHGDLESQEDIPQSFKDAIRDLNNGKVVPLDDILEEKMA